MSYKIHLTSHSTYGGETQESLLLSPKHLRDGGLSFSGSDHFLPLNWFSFLEYLYLSSLTLICYPFPRLHLGVGPVWHKMQCVWDLYKCGVYVQNWTGTYSRECYIFVFFAWKTSLMWIHGLHGPMKHFHVARCLLCPPSWALSSPELSAKNVLFYLILTTIYRPSPY